MDWDVVSLVLDRKGDDLQMVPASMDGFWVAKLPHESYPMLIRNESKKAQGQLLIGLSEADLDRIVFFEGEEYVLRECEVETGGGDTLTALYFDEGVMPPAKMESWDFEEWAANSKDYMMGQSAVYMSYYGHMTAAEADVYWQNYCGENPEVKLAS